MNDNDLVNSIYSPEAFKQEQKQREWNKKYLALRDSFIDEVCDVILAEINYKRSLLINAFSVPENIAKVKINANQRFIIDDTRHILDYIKKIYKRKKHQQQINEAIDGFNAIGINKLVRLRVYGFSNENIDSLKISFIKNARNMSVEESRVRDDLNQLSKHDRYNQLITVLNQTEYAILDICGHFTQPSKINKSNLKENSFFSLFREMFFGPLFLFGLFSILAFISLVITTLEAYTDSTLEKQLAAYKAFAMFVGVFSFHASTAWFLKD